MWNVYNVGFHHCGCLLFTNDPGSNCWRNFILLHQIWMRRNNELIFAAEVDVSAIRCSNIYYLTWSANFFLTRMPFDDTTVYGFIATVTIQLGVGIAYFLSTLPSISLLLSMGLYLGAFCSHFETMFRNMSDLVVDLHDCNNFSVFEKALLLRTWLVEAIRFHNQAKEWAR